jgi:hypothetical protein
MTSVETVYDISSLQKSLQEINVMTGIMWTEKSLSKFSQENLRNEKKVEKLELELEQARQKLKECELLDPYVEKVDTLLFQLGVAQKHEDAKLKIQERASKIPLNMVGVPKRLRQKMENIKS